MFQNPFTPLFGGKPECFFGRSRVLSRFDVAMSDRGSDDRALFITGSRGYGKTALLEQLSIRAKGKGRKVIDVGPDNPVGGIMRHLVAYDELTRTVEPELEVNVLGTGGKLSVGSDSKTVRYDRDDFERVFLRACEHDNFKLLLTIDEIQKVSLDDVALICGAFQMASRKGFDVMIAVAGLPYAYDRVIQHDGCTFMRRSSHEQLGPLAPDEVRDAFRASIEGIKSLTISETALEELCRNSKGHPYVMQLQGYYLIDFVNQKISAKRYEITEGDALEVMPRVLDAYNRRALEPLVSAMPSSEVAYLRAMAACLNEERMASTSEVARFLGKELSQLSVVRGNLIDNGIVLAPCRGKLMFMIPYLAEYVLEESTDAEQDIDAFVRWKM